MSLAYCQACLDELDGRLYSYISKDALKHVDWCVCPNNHYKNECFNKDTKCFGIARVGMEGQKIKAGKLTDDVVATLNKVIAEVASKFA
mgnify:CR=1 FL=1